MKSTRHVHSPDTRRRAATSLRFLTRLAAVAATGATVVIGLVVAKEHPGATASGSAPLPGPEHLHDGGADDDHLTIHDHTDLIEPRRRLFVAHNDNDCAPDNDDHCATDDHDDSAGRDVWCHKTMTAPSLAPPDTATTERSFRALGTTATVVVTAAEHADEAERLLRAEVEAMDLACSRFRPDSELASFHASAGRTVEVSPLLFEALDVAYEVAERTHGAVDPTVGSALAALGYDRHFEEIESRPLRLADLGPVPGFRHLHLDHTHRTARIPEHVRLDLGSSAKALLADQGCGS